MSLVPKLKKEVIECSFFFFSYTCSDFMQSHLHIPSISPTNSSPAILPAAISGTNWVYLVGVSYDAETQGTMNLGFTSHFKDGAKLEQLKGIEAPVLFSYTNCPTFP